MLTEEQQRSEEFHQASRNQMGGAVLKDRNVEAHKVAAIAGAAVELRRIGDILLRIETALRKPHTHMER